MGGITSRPVGRTDEEFLDHLFDRLTQELRDGREVDLTRELEGRDHLRAQAEELDETREDLRIERTAVALGRDRLLERPVAVNAAFRRACPVASAALEASRGLEVVARLEEASAQDLRALGLIAYLCDVSETTLAAWSRLERLGSDDPLIQGLHGTVLLANGDPARAFPRTRTPASSTHWRRA